MLLMPESWTEGQVLVLVGGSSPVCISTSGRNRLHIVGAVSIATYRDVLHAKD